MQETNLEPESGRDEAAERELRHDVGGALTAVLASLEVAHDVVNDESPEARAELRTAIAHARDAAARAADGFIRLRR
jgi:predicted negative regulator of RcsB-dependent stress response